jgi:curved DNA-binding protein CbpA
MADYYKVLGLAHDASPEEIKRRFRELARRWHPDVAGTPDATEKFKTINEAYRVLGNPRTRAQYDAELKLKEQRAEARQRPQYDSTQPRSRPEARTGTARPNSTAGTRAGARRPTEPPGRSQVVNQLLHEAEVAIQRMRLHEAARTCRTVLNLDPRNATAYEMLGDICSMRGQVDAALAHYTMALQLDRNNSRLRAKFERAAGEGLVRNGAGEGKSGTLAMLARQSLALIFGLGAIGVVLAFVASAAAGHQSATGVPLDWTPAVFIALPTAGVIAGWVSSYAALLRPARSELLVVSPSRKGRSVVPMGVILIVLSLACFWLAGVLYGIVAFTQEALSRSIMTAFILCACLVGIFAAVTPEAFGPVLMLGGNMVFPAFVGGWALADRARPQ